MCTTAGLNFTIYVCGLTFQDFRVNSNDCIFRRPWALTIMGTVACDRTSHRTISFHLVTAADFFLRQRKFTEDLTSGSTVARHRTSHRIEGTTLVWERNK